MSYVDKKISRTRHVGVHNALRLLQSSDTLYHNLKSNISLYSHDDLMFIKTTLEKARRNIDKALELIK